MCFLCQLRLCRPHHLLVCFARSFVLLSVAINSPPWTLSQYGSVPASQVPWRRLGRSNYAPRMLKDSLRCSPLAARPPIRDLHRLPFVWLTPRSAWKDSAPPRDAPSTRLPRLRSRCTAHSSTPWLRLRLSFAHWLPSSAGPAQPSERANMTRRHQHRSRRFGTIGQRVVQLSGIIPVHSWLLFFDVVLD